jgi:hypothetical protein
VVVAAAVGAWFVLAPGDDDPSDRAASTTTQPLGASASTTTTTDPSIILTDYSKGDCATWDQTRDPAPSKIVDCDDPHLIELIDSREVSTQLDRYPTDAEWEYFTATLCGPLVEKYLGARIDPQGLYEAGSVWPSREGWDQGFRDLECGVIHAGDSRLPNLLVPFSGAADGAHQYVAKAAGTCLPLAGDGTGEPVPCDQPHALEVVGAVDLTGRIDHAPNDDELDTLLGDECRREATAYVGHSLDGDLGEGWIGLLPGAWDGGHRVLECTVGRYPAAGGDPITITGSLRTAS